MLLALSCYDVARATTTISSGHVDIFEAEYEVVSGTATLHLGVHAGDYPNEVHYEPDQVIFQVKNAAYRSTDGFSENITTLLGANAWILPADTEQAANLGLIEAGVAKAGFPAGSVTFTMVGAGPANPGNFALFNSTNEIRLSATGSEVETSSFSYAGSHVHYNWGFSAPGTYTFDMQASYDTNPDPLVVGLLQSSVEKYTFNVIPEPSTGVLLMAGLATLSAVRRRTRR